MNSPCHYCTERRFNCHALCGKYKDWRKKQDEIAEKRNAEKDPRNIPTLGRKTVKHIWKGMKNK